MPTANELYQQAKVSGNVSFQAEWGRTQQQLAKLSQGERVSQLGFSSLEPGEYVMAYDAQGQARMRIGHQSDGTVGVIYGNGKPPPVPSAPSVGARQLGVFVGWDGLFADSYAKPGDFARIDVHMSEEQGFLPDGTTIVGTIPQEGGILVGADSVTHYIKLVAVNSSDVPSAPTAEVAVLPLPAGQIAAGAIGAQQLAADIAMVSRLIVGNPTAARLELDGRTGATAPGMHLFNGAGSETLTMDATTGAVKMMGEFRTADSGPRIVMRESGTNSIRFYSSASAQFARIESSGYGVDTAGVGLFSSQALSLTNKPQSFIQVYPQVARIAASGYTPSGDYITGADVSVQINALFLTGPLGTTTDYKSQIIVTPSYTSMQRFRLDEVPTEVNVANNQVDVFVSPVRFRFGVNSSNFGLFQSTTQSTGMQFGPTSISVYNPSTGALKEIVASNVTTGSARESKTAIEALPYDAERAIVAAPVTMWERKAERRDAKGRLRVARKNIGPMADDLPEALQVKFTMPGTETETLGIDLGAQIATVWAATGQQTARLDDLTARLAALEGAS